MTERGILPSTLKGTFIPLTVRENGHDHVANGLFTELTPSVTMGGKQGSLAVGVCKPSCRDKNGDQVEETQSQKHQHMNLGDTAT